MPQISSAGPVIGSGLYSVDGFGLPFWISGAIGLLLSLVLVFIMPSKKIAVPSDSESMEVSDLWMTDLTFNDALFVCQSYKYNYLLG